MSHGQVDVACLTLSVREGEVLGFLGPNGAGKTTTMNVLLGFTNATQALINDPDLLILDEPTSGLDPIGRMKVREIILTIQLLAAFFTPTMGLFGAATDCATPDKVTLQLKWLPQAQFAGYYAAQDLGHYKDECLEVTMR